MTEQPILIIDDDTQYSSLIKKSFRGFGIPVSVSQKPLNSISSYEGDFDVVVVNIDDIGRRQILLKELAEKNQKSKILVIGNSSDEQSIVSLLQKGVCDYLRKPVDPDLFLHIVRRALEAQKTETELDHTQMELLYSRGKQRELCEHLEKLKQESTDTNRALSVLTRNLERVKKETEGKIIDQMRHLILPIIEQMRKDQHMRRYDSKLTMIANYIESLDSQNLKGLYGNTSLSARELRIALMIKYGMTTEEIAEHLHITPTTVKTHRRNIRKKLGAQGMKQRLRVYIQSLEQDVMHMTEEQDLDVAFR